MIGDFYDDPLERFFAFAKERHSIYLRRKNGEPKPWSQDPILQKYRFTNVYRELDRTTVWFKEHVREPMWMQPEVLLATVVFRWFNRISTGEAIFCHPDLGGRTAFDRFLESKDRASLRSDILALCGDGPYVTGAYIIQTRGAAPGLSKLEGVLELCENVARSDWREIAQECLDDPIPWGLRDMFEWLQEFPSMGPFMAYEVVTDLRWTDLLYHAHDIMTWANPGPGARRGMNRVKGRDLNASVSDQQLIIEMQDILARVKYEWPPSWTPWEMREVEHTLCEHDKYERARLGQGRPRGMFE